MKEKGIGVAFVIAIVVIAAVAAVGVYYLGARGQGGVGGGGGGGGGDVEPERYVTATDATVEATRMDDNSIHFRATATIYNPRDSTVYVGWLVVVFKTAQAELNMGPSVGNYAEVPAGGQVSVDFETILDQWHAAEWFPTPGLKEITVGPAAYTFPDMVEGVPENEVSIHTTVLIPP